MYNRRKRFVAVVFVCLKLQRKYLRIELMQHAPISLDHFTNILLIGIMPYFILIV